MVIYLLLGVSRYGFLCNLQKHLFSSEILFVVFFNTLGTHIFFFVYFWLNSVFFFILDIYQPKFFMKYKIQEDKAPGKEKLLKAVRVVMRNQFIGFLISIPSYYVYEWRGMTYGASELPTFMWFMLELCVYILIEEIGFYYTHR